jgi:copper resistance protein B
MKTPMTLAPFAAGLLFAFNAAAQDHAQHQMPAATPQGHSQHQMPTSATQDHSQHKAKPKAKRKATPAAKPAPKSSQDVDHAAMGHGMPGTQAPQVDHAAMGHDVPVQEPDHTDHAAMGHDAPRPADQPLTPIPELTDVDRAAAVRPAGGHPMNDNAPQRFVLIDRLEAFDAEAGHGLEWEAQAWLGTDLNKLWLRSEGERVGGNLEDADLEVLYGRSVARWWDVVAGVRHHFEPGDSQDMAVLGVMGVAHYKFEVQASLYAGDSGYTGARLEVEYETLLTSRLILQPALEVNIHGQDDKPHGNGSGLGTVEAGLRLRYEISRQFAPYIGVVHQRAYGRTADFRRDDGEDINDTRIVAGVRIWF